jgi:hypothetical protein
MAEQQNSGGGSNMQNYNSTKQNSYTKGLSKDFNDSFIPEGVWTNAINAVTSSHSGDAGTIGNEPSTLFCTRTVLEVIGLVRRDSDTWFVFSTDDVSSEIGIFTESTCAYEIAVNNGCLGFKKSNLITGVTQTNYDCTYTVFFADGLNPDRAFNPDKTPWQIKMYDLTNPECPIPIYYEPKQLDCNKLRLHYLVNTPCYSLENSNSAGSLFNGSYQVAVAYTINGLRVSNYFNLSNTAAIWSHENTGGSLDLVFTQIDTTFEEYEVALISTVNSQTMVKKIGNYSTTQTRVHIDIANDTFATIPLSDIPVNQAIYDTSDKIFSLNFYLLRSGVKTKFDFNYQPLANQIVTKWVQVEYPANYYALGNNQTGYMRDEVYSFFIRWVYNTGDKSASYHIPGRPALANDLILVGGQDVLPYDNSGNTTAPKWRVYNTAKAIGGSGTLPNGGVIKNTGYMGYWESEEHYPVKPSVYNSNLGLGATVPYPGTAPTDYDLCGGNIRHHKFPDDGTAPIYDDSTKGIQLLGVKFENIMVPVDLAGKPIKNIVGYEILRGSREGNRSIIAKGVINNMWEFDIPDQTGAKGLYQNYPFNCLQPDYFLRKDAWYTPYKPSDHEDSSNPMTIYKKDYFSFHTPEFKFTSTYLNPSEIKVYNEYIGTSNGNFAFPYGHPEEKIPSQGAFIGCLLVGLGMAIAAFTGDKSRENSNIGSATTQTSTQVIGALVQPAIGNTVSTNASVLGAVGWSAGNQIGVSTGTSVGVTYPKTMTVDSALSNLSPTGKSGDLFDQILSYAQKLSLIASTGGFFLAQGFSTTMKAFMEFIPFVQYALQFNSHAFYNRTKTPKANNTRRQIKSSRFVSSSIQQFNTNYIVNNLYRPNTAVINTINTIADPSTIDVSRRTVNQLGIWDDPTKRQSTQTSCYYAGLKLDYKSQYGQLNSIVQIPIGTCTQLTKPNLGTKYNSQVYFGGDVYINRFTELNKFPLFTNWMVDFPDGTEYNYKLHANLPYPRYYANFSEIDINQIKITAFPKFNVQGGNIINKVKGIINFFKDLVVNLGQFAYDPINALGNVAAGPSLLYHMDRDPNSYSVNFSNILNSKFYIRDAYFYLFVNGVRDFYCESEINLADRDYGTQTYEQFYNPYGFTNLSELFRSDLIKTPEFYKYDFSMSVARSVTSFASWGKMLPIGYDPAISESCFSYYPTRMVYSLQQQYEQSRDNWRIFLANNYKDFENVVTSVKPINRTGAVILFDDAVPTTINGVDELQTSTGNRITVGDAGLFNQSFQALTNSDLELEYGSCQSSRSVINTTYGVFWMSQRNGKIMQLAGNQIVDISMNGMRHWFAENLVYQLLKYYPTYPFTDNPVKGVGCQVAYDNQYELLYFTKTDYRPIDPITTVYDPEAEKFKVKSYSYKFTLSYGVNPNYDILNNTVFDGTINGVQVSLCQYTTAVGIVDFVKCINDNLTSVPEIGDVVYTIGATSFTFTIYPKNPNTPIVFDLFYNQDPAAIPPADEPIIVEEFEYKYIDPSDSEYFEDCSWTISYDPRTKMWLSFHDWHPDLMFSSNDHFYSIKDNGFWKHNTICDSYNVYYDKNHGWEVEFPINTIVNVTTIKSIEYYMEVFSYNNNCVDRYHVLDGNFDQAMIYNTEQTSGLLNLHIKPKNNPVALLNYPKINADSIDIHVAKEENKYRFNQFWDVVADRGEMSGKEFTIFETECNGYRKNLNANAVNYSKSPLERKKFRHYGNRLVLRKFDSQNLKMNLKIVATKETLSPR